MDERVDNVTAFQWQSQLRYSQHDKTRECQVCNVSFMQHVACMSLLTPHELATPHMHLSLRVYCR